MSIDCNNFVKLCSGELCNLTLVAYISGCIGLIWRIVIMGMISKSISTHTVYDVYAFYVFYCIALTYILVSIVLNGCFVWGIYKRRKCFVLGYIIVLATEMTIGVIGVSAIVMLLFAVSVVGYGFLFIFVTAISIAIAFLIWLHHVLLYKDFEEVDSFRPNGERNMSLSE
ncbi:uncharacterized protein LOC115876440 [Sitophilus oryzae]|uniref:Uncharacterized protein LOC115876440 n=1 Tax=Sitophilus oryzae TaxID=7048 RepID=A0A6J2XA66_SITOR|nr:uncharacterized protein LOC115876440 [Sitophilus oryzae]